MFSWLSALISLTLHSSGNEMKNFAALEWHTYSVLTLMILLCSIGMTSWFSVDTLDPPLWWWYWNDLLIQRWSSGPSAETYLSSFNIVNSILILRWFRFRINYYWIKIFVVVLLEWPTYSVLILLTLLCGSDIEMTYRIRCKRESVRECNSIRKFEMKMMKTLIIMSLIMSVIMYNEISLIDIHMCNQQIN